MSQIVTLYSDKEKTDALYPRTKVSAISDDNNTPLKELMTGMVKQEEGGAEEEVVTPINADTLGGKLTANNVVFYEEEMVDEFGQVVVRNADKLNNKNGDYYDYRNSTLTLEEIQASTDLTGKIASASALKNVIGRHNLYETYAYTSTGKSIKISYANAPTVARYAYFLFGNGNGTPWVGIALSNNGVFSGFKVTTIPSTASSSELSFI